MNSETKTDALPELTAQQRKICDAIGAMFVELGPSGPPCAAITAMRTGIKIGRATPSTSVAAQGERQVLRMVEEWWLSDENAEARQQGAPACIFAVRRVLADRQGEYVPMLDDDGRTMVCNSAHYTTENIRAMVDDLRAIERGDEVVPAADRDWRTQCGIYARIISALADEWAAPTPETPTNNSGERDAETCKREFSEWQDAFCSKCGPWPDSTMEAFGSCWAAAWQAARSQPAPASAPEAVMPLLPPPYAWNIRDVWSAAHMRDYGGDWRCDAGRSARGDAAVAGVPDAREDGLTFTELAQVFQGRSDFLSLSDIHRGLGNDRVDAARAASQNESNHG